MIFICLVGCAITWPILMPINAVGGGSSKELDRVTIGNVYETRYLYAHAIVAWVFFGFVMFTVARERLWLIGLRQAWNLSKPNANRLSSRTVLFLSAPTVALDENNMRRFFGEEAVKLWPVTKAESLQGLVSSRDTKVDELESAEISLIRKVNEEGRRSQDRHHGQRITYGSLPDGVKQSLRPTQRLKTVKPVGKQVDSINFSRDQLLEKEEEINKARESNATAQSHHGAAAVFVQFRTQAAAQKAYQQVASSDILSLTPRFTGVAPGEIVWENLTIPPSRRISQGILAHGLVIALIIFWSIPVAFVGAVSNVSYLAQNFKFLSFLNELPDGITNLLTGLLPPLLLSALSKYVPKIFRCKCVQVMSRNVTNVLRHLHYIRRAHEDVYGIEGPEMVLCIPSSSGLLSDYAVFWCGSCCITDREEPKSGSSAACRTLTSRLQLVPHILRRTRSDERFGQSPQLL